MDKQILLDVIDSYHLNGLAESVILNVKDKDLTVNFITATKDTLGCIKTKSQLVDIEDCKIGIFNTSELIKLLKIADKEIVLGVEKEENILVKLNIFDIRYNSSYHLSELGLIEQPPDINQPIQYDYLFDINKEFINTFNDGFNAVGKVGRCTVQAKEVKNKKIIEIVIGDNNRHANKIKFCLNGEFLIGGGQIPFPASVLKEILSVNKNRNGKIEISEQGLMKIIFSDENLDSTYFIVRLT